MRSMPSCLRSFRWRQRQITSPTACSAGGCGVRRSRFGIAASSKPTARARFGTLRKNGASDTTTSMIASGTVSDVAGVLYPALDQRAKREGQYQAAVYVHARYGWRELRVQTRPVQFQ